MKTWLLYIYRKVIESKIIITMMSTLDPFAEEMGQNGL
jgi:hypothetical protein